MNAPQTPSPVASNILYRATIPIDFSIVCLWTAVGLVLTALVFTLGFGAEVGQALAVAG